MCVSDNRELQTTRLHGVTAQRLFCGIASNVYVTADPFLTNRELLCSVHFPDQAKEKKGTRER